MGLVNMKRVFFLGHKARAAFLVFFINVVIWTWGILCSKGLKWSISSLWKRQDSEPVVVHPACYSLDRSVRWCPSWCLLVFPAVVTSLEAAGLNLAAADWKSQERKHQASWWEDDWCWSQGSSSRGPNCLQPPLLLYRCSQDVLASPPGLAAKVFFW